MAGKETASVALENPPALSGYAAKRQPKVSSGSPTKTVSARDALVDDLAKNVGANAPDATFPVVIGPREPEDSFPVTKVVQ